MVIHDADETVLLRISIPPGIELPQFVRTAQKSPYVGNIKFYAVWRSVSGATPVFNWIRSWL